MNRNAKAKETYTEAMGAFVAENYHEAIRRLGEAVAEDPAFTLAVISRGAAHLKLGHTEDAIADFDKALAIDENNARAHHLRGLARERQGDLGAAAADFDRAIALNPEYGAAYYSRATLRSRVGREDEAVEDIEMVAHLTERNIEAFAADNNVWRSRQLYVESAYETEIDR